MVLTLVYAPYLIRVDWKQTSATQNSPQRQADDPTSMLLHFSKQVSSIAKAPGEAMLADDKKRENCAERSGKFDTHYCYRSLYFSRLLVKTRICLSQVTGKTP